jgi:mRNA-degrading endonuclease RelE of RelBE toxin-antitoxin system
MNKIDKFLKKLTQKEPEVILELLSQLKTGHLSGLDIKRLKGFDNYFRVRKGDVRILFHLDINGIPIIEEIVRRSDTTYS